MSTIPPPTEADLVPELLLVWRHSHFDDSTWSGRVLRGMIRRCHAKEARVAELEEGLRETEPYWPLHTGRLSGREFIHDEQCLRCRLAALLGATISAADPGPVPQVVEDQALKDSLYFAS